MTTSEKGEQTVKLRPTLFIAVGGSGMEVILRIRRRILSTAWGSSANPRRVESLEKFHIAEFLHFDLDHGSVVESGKSQNRDFDILTDLVRLSDDDKVIENFNIEKYSRSDDDLDRYPHIAEWSPLTPRKIRELGIDASKGAGQIRGISRLYFFDKYPKLRDRIRTKLHSLKSSLSKENDLKKLGLEIDTSKFRIVVIGSIAGGTGAGAFLDMGWLASAIAAQDLSAYEVDMMMFLPSGYASANKERTEANGYASLMELETCMKGGSNFVRRWDLHDNMQLAAKPFDEVYLIDSGNLTGQATSDQRDVYEMVADTLFDNFRSADFANKKRSVAVNQSQHKITPFSAPVPLGRFGDMKLNYFKGYSAFGQAVLDTQSASLEELNIYRWIRAMLEVFFGVASDDQEANRATFKQRDEFLYNHLYLKPVLFEQVPEFSSNVELPFSNGSFYDYALTEKLLHDKQGSLLASVEQRVQRVLEAMAARLDKDDWPGLIRGIIDTLERDCMRNQDRAADTSEDRITEARKRLRAEMQEALQSKFYQYIDNRDLGGLTYALSLVEQIKDRLTSIHDGVIKQQQQNAYCYAEIRDALRTSECERLLANLAETKGNSLFSNKDKQARYILNDLKREISNYLQFHLRATAASQAGLLLQELVEFMGGQGDLDENGEVIWTGLVGQFQQGRNSVMSMLGEVRDLERCIEEDNKAQYASYCRVDAPSRIPNMPTKARLAEWADSSLKEIGGSRKLFKNLETLEGQMTILRRLGRRARAEYDAIDIGDVDPLAQALEKMDPAARQKVFANWLSRAMPWIDANMGREFTPHSDQFKCYIGVGRSADYLPFRDDIIASLPAQVGVTPAQVSFVDSGVFGRAVCYVELSGIPLTVLRGLETWQTSYMKESEKIPVHTKSDATAFEHPLVPTVRQLNVLANDFGIYLQAVMLGLLLRDPNPQVRPAGQYQFSVGRGDVRRMGNERSFRLNGLPKAYQQKISETVSHKLSDLDGWQMIALGALADYLARDTYAPRLQPDEKGTEVAVQGFASAVAESLRTDLLTRAETVGLSQDSISDFETLAFNELDRWTDVIENSDQDAYSWEVREGSTPRLKRIVKEEFFHRGWIERTLGEAWQTEIVADSDILHQSSQAVAAVDPALLQVMQTVVQAVQHPVQPVQQSAQQSVMPPPVPTRPGMSLDYNYHIHLNGQNMGPYSGRDIIGYVESGQFSADTLCWREGWPTWLAIKDVAELRPLVGTPPRVPLP